MSPFHTKNTLRTDELEEQLSASLHLDEFLQENQDQFLTGELRELLAELIQKQGISKSELARRAHMSDVYLFQILNGRRTPSRDRLLSLCIALGCSVNEVQEILKQFRYNRLYVKDRRDAVILYGIERKWDVAGLNDALYNAGEETLV